MTLEATILMFSVQGLTTVCTVFFFVRILKAMKKQKDDV